MALDKNENKPTVINDFGFTFSDEDELLKGNSRYSSLNEELYDLKSRLNELKGIFLPLLQNLSKEPSKPMIKWPNREQILKNHIEKLLNLTDIN